MNNQAEFEEIERYLESDFSKEERLAFEEKMRKSVELEEKVNQAKKVRLAIERSELAKKLEDFHQEMRPSLPQKPIFYYWAAAVVLFVISGLAIWWFLQIPSNDEKLFLSYYKADPGLVTKMSTEGHYEFNRAMVDYKSGLFEEAMLKWEKQYISKPENDTLSYFIGSAKLALNRPKEASIYLEKVAHNASSIFYSDANWYMGLTYLKLSNHSKAIDYLRRSERPKSSELIEKLNEE